MAARKKKASTTYRSAESGQFVTEATAEEAPGSTVSELREPPAQEAYMLRSSSAGKLVLGAGLSPTRELGERFLLAKVDPARFELVRVSIRIEEG